LLDVLDKNQELCLKKDLSSIADLDSRHVVLPKALWVQNDTLFILLEYCFSNLGFILEMNRIQFRRQKFDSMTVPEYFISSELLKELLEGLNYLHKLRIPIVHRNLKPNNILITHGIDGKFVKLSDFSSWYTEENVKKISQTERDVKTNYMAPEYFRREICGVKADIYSLGLITKEIFDISSA